MATERIDIVITERGSREVRRRLQDVGNSGVVASRGIDLLKRALLVIGGVQLIRGIIDLADAFITIQNRIKVVTKDTNELVLVTDELFKIARETRSSFESTATVYSRTALAVRELGISQQQTLDFTKSLNQAVILSGVGAREAAAALIQLSQGLSSNRLSGDELRSVLEQLPVVADVIAKQMNTTRGALRDLGQQGKITSSVILEAFKNAREELNERFLRTIPTIGQGFIAIRDAVIRVVGGFSTATGFSEKLSKALFNVADNMETLARVALAAAIAVGTTFGTIGINKAIAGVRRLTIAIATNPLGALAVAITATVTLLIAFSDQITLTSDSFVTLQDFALAAFQVIRDNFLAFLQIIQPKLDALKAALSTLFGDVEFSFQGFLQISATSLDAFVGLFVGSFNAIVVIFERLPDTFRNIFRKAFQGALNLAEGYVNGIIAIVNEIPFIGDKFKPIDLNADSLFGGDAQGKAQSLGEAIGDAFNQGFVTSTAATDVLGEITSRAEIIARNRLKQESLNQVEQEQAKGNLGATGQDLVSGLKAQEAVLERRKELLIDIKGPQAEFATAQQDLKVLLDEGKISLEEYNVALTNLQIKSLETSTTAADGFKRGFLRIKADILDVASAAENVLTNAFSSAEDALVSFVQTGQFNFSSFVDSILADVTKLLARQAITSLIGAFAGPAGAAGGGFLSGLSGVFGGARAAGGPVDPNRAFLVGEKGPELFQPRSSGNIIPTNALGNMAANPPEVNVQVINVQGENEIPSAMASREGDRTILNALTRNKSAARSALGI